MKDQERKGPTNQQATGQGPYAVLLLVIAAVFAAVLANPGAIAFAGKLTDMSKAPARVNQVDSSPLTGSSGATVSGQGSAASVAPRIPDAKNPPARPLD